MSTSLWKVTYQVHRQKSRGPSYYDDFTIEVDPDEYVLDGIERLWAFHDRSLVFRHACHHSTCGACGMRVNGVEKLTCITPVREVTRDGGTIKVEPMRNFPLISDLAVDMGLFYSRMDLVGHRPVVADTEEGAGPVPRPAGPVSGEEDFIRLSDCIECGLCISACPIAATTPGYLGPAVLAGAQQHGLDSDLALLEIVDGEDGVWRCHSAFECTAVCPSFVEPAWRIMDLRKQVVRQKVQRLFRPRKEAK